MQNTSYVELLSRVPFLTSVPHEDLEPLAQRSVLRRFEAGQRVVTQGEFGHSMFVLGSGALAIYATGEDGTQLFLGRLDQPGQFFGEVALLGRGVRSASVYTEVPTVLLEIERNPFELVTRRHESALAELEKYYHARAISTYIRLHRYLGQLDDDTLRELTAGATMRKYSRNEVVCKTGDPATTVMLVKDGVLKMARAGRDGRLSILAYFNSDDVAGSHDGTQRTYELITLGQAEVIFLDRRAFNRLERTHPQVHARFSKDNMHRAETLASAGNTVFGAAEAFLNEGVEVESLLVINLDRCVRCGNCVRACHARHRFTRLDRRGPIFRRRVSVDSTRHEHLMIPSSCRHCRDPECMIGCPTGAIQRHPDGDVVINDNCIGCDNCARKCPYGNITMRPLPPEEQRENVVKRAIKCDLCRGHEYSNCVHECPRGAVLRIDPLRYFDELSMIMDAEQEEALRARRRSMRQSARQAVEADNKQRIKPRSTAFVWISLAVFAAALVGLVGAYLASPEPRGGKSAWGLGFGVLAAGLVVVAMLVGARKRMRNAGLGAFEVWVQFHMIVGLLGFVAALAHTGFRITGLFTTILLAIFAVQVLTGVAGQALYMVLPRMLTRLERGGLSKLFEDLVAEELDLVRGMMEITQKSPPEVGRFAHGPLRRAAGSVWARLRKGYDAGEQRERTRKALDLAAIPPAHRATAERLIKDTVRLVDVRAQLMLHRGLRHWLLIHVATTGALAIFLAVHIVTMLLLIL